MNPGSLVLLGEFGRAHGLKGEVRLKAFTADPSAIADYNPLFTRDGRRIVLTDVRRAPGGAPDLLIVRVDGVTTREAAEALTRIELFVPRDRLPPPEDDDEFLLTDLIGLPVRNREGETIGHISAIPNYGGGDLLEITPSSSGPAILLPFTKAFVPIIDLKSRQVIVDYLESGPDRDASPED